MNPRAPKTWWFLLCLLSSFEGSTDETHALQNQSSILKRHHSGPHEVNKYKRWQRQVTSASDLSTGLRRGGSPRPSSFQCGCKKINPGFQCKGDELKQTMIVVVFLPYDPYFAFSIERILPALEIAVESDTKDELLDGWNVTLLPTDSKWVF